MRKESRSLLLVSVISGFLLAGVSVVAQAQDALRPVLLDVRQDGLEGFEVAVDVAEDGFHGRGGHQRKKNDIASIE